VANLLVAAFFTRLVLRLLALDSTGRLARFGDGRSQARPREVEGVLLTNTNSGSNAYD